MNVNYKLGITKSFPCSYLPEQEERLLIAVDDNLHDSEHYGWLMQQGFRRSGNDIYRPHCLACQACQSLRVLVADFMPSKSQKRLLKRNQSYQVKMSKEIKASYYPLYEQYINTIHHDGSMFPATYEQFQSFTQNNITEQRYIEIWHDDLLISVAVTDEIPEGLSAVYTFYHPNYRKDGLGVFSILKQIEIAAQLALKFLYLGYQIEGCQKMNYKNRYYPHQILVENQWKNINK
ncbi:arginyltransferase [Colwellia sp. Arc7-635]|jgi:arginine-tRNA-protein transferase|uniref:arginyltransferase n=1 Tax=Colwellia sp. Arc7-635 TaxID=2497879 RepID=UPI000F85B307|nr:arginyltransferase [Colwellia sp. Arc7-635]AZQ84566.1 arginyltransferase [Colwellia sp. Arc7-635]